MTIGSVSSRKVITTDDGRQYKKPGLGKQYLGYTAGSAVAGGVALGSNVISSFPLIKTITKIPSHPIYSTGADVVLATSGLASKGVKIVNAVNSARPQVAVIIDDSLKSLNKFPILKKIMRKINEFMIVDPTFKGMNAFFEPKSNTIVVNKGKLGYATFHEMGHAINKNFSKFGKILQKMRGPSLLAASVIPLIALSKRTKADGEKPKGFFDKVTTFIKNNAGKLTFLSFVPLLLEEGLASLNAAKLGKSVLDPKLLKNMSKFNTAAWLTYLSLAVGAGVGTMLGVKLKDKITKPKEIKQNI